jgi:hypothetical protein
MYFSYAFAADVTENVKLEILDPVGTVLRSFTGVAPSRLSNRAGLHRFRWDFTLPGPEGPPRPGDRGPWVAPGSYQVRLTAGNWSETKNFRLLIDPRLPADGVTDAVLAAQLAMSLQLRDLVTQSRRVVSRLAEVRRKAAALRGAPADAVRRALPQLMALEARLVTAEGRYQTPMLADQIAFLYDVSLAADQQLGRDVSERYHELVGLLAMAKQELDAIAAAVSDSVSSGS